MVREVAEPQRAGPQTFSDKLGHAVAVILGRRLAVGAALAHDIDAHRRVRHLRRHVDVVAAGAERVEKFGECLPVPGQTFGQHHLGDVLHAFHQLDQHIALLRPAGREADAAIADQDGGYAVPRGWADAIGPGHLRVVVGVDVDEARRDQLATGVDFPVALGQRPANRCDLFANDGNVAFVAWRPGAIDDGASTDHERLGHSPFLQRLLLDSSPPFRAWSTPSGREFG